MRLPPDSPRLDELRKLLVGHFIAVHPVRIQFDLPRRLRHGDVVAAHHESPGGDEDHLRAVCRVGSDARAGGERRRFDSGWRDFVLSRRDNRAVRRIGRVSNVMLRLIRMLNVQLDNRIMHVIALSYEGSPARYWC